MSTIVGTTDRERTAGMDAAGPLRLLVIAFGAGGVVLMFFQPQLGVLLLLGAAMFGGYQYFYNRELQKRRTASVENRSGNEQVLLDLERDGLLSAVEAHELRNRWSRGPDGDLEAVVAWRESRRRITPLQVIAVVGILLGGFEILTGNQFGIGIVVVSAILLVVAIAMRKGRTPIVDAEFDEAASFRSRKVQLRQPIDADQFSEDLRRLHERFKAGDITDTQYGVRRKKIIHP